MGLPQSFNQFMQGGRKKVKLRNGRFLKPLMIGSDGQSNRGKTEFIHSLPGPGVNLAIDRGVDGCIDNPNPPASRNPEWFDWVVPIPVNMNNPAVQASIYVPYFKTLRDNYNLILDNPDVVSMGIDCDSDFWELHKLAAFGKLYGVMPLRYAGPYAEHKALIAKAWDSGKHIIGTNKVKDAYEDILDTNGVPIAEADGTNKRKKSGDVDRQGFPDTDYLWQIQIRHLMREGAVIPGGPMKGKRMKPTWGLRILKCKARPELAGEELWGEKCCFRGLVNFIYPQIADEDWGF